MINPWVILVAVLLFAGGLWLGERDGADRVETRCRAESGEARAKAEADAKALEAQARQQETQWQEVVNGTVRNYEAKIHDIRAGLERDLVRVRGRAPRAAAVPGLPAPAGTACPRAGGATGAELSGADANFLVREAARADAVAAGLDACYGVLDGVTP